jgi:cytochrome c
MNKIIVVLLAGFVCIACGEKKNQEDFGKPSASTPAQEQLALGKKLFEGVGLCHTCHKTDQKIIGPSVKEIAKIYKDMNLDMVAFLRGELEPVVDPEQYEVMKTNFTVTKAMTDDELRAIEAYFYSFVK